LAAWLLDCRDGDGVKRRFDLRFRQEIKGMQLVEQLPVSLEVAAEAIR
jgi:hypothetical protein